MNAHEAILAGRASLVETAETTRAARGPDADLLEAGAWRVFRLSWLAYASPLINAPWRFLVAVGAPSMVAASLWRGSALANAITIVGLAVLAAWTVYDALVIRSVKLYTDSRGVWVRSGLVPWARGEHGVQWRDVGEASCRLGFLPWALRSYRVSVTHRFTTMPEINLRHVKKGHEAVQHIHSILTAGPGA